MGVTLLTAKQEAVEVESKIRKAIIEIYEAIDKVEYSIRRAFTAVIGANAALEPDSFMFAFMPNWHVEKVLDEGVLNNVLIPILDYEDDQLGSVNAINVGIMKAKKVTYKLGNTDEIKVMELSVGGRKLIYTISPPSVAFAMFLLLNRKLTRMFTKICPQLPFMKKAFKLADKVKVPLENKVTTMPLVSSSKVFVGTDRVTFGRKYIFEERLMMERSGDVKEWASSEYVIELRDKKGSIHSFKLSDYEALTYLRLGSLGDDVDVAKELLKYLKGDTIKASYLLASVFAKTLTQYS